MDNIDEIKQAIIDSSITTKVYIGCDSKVISYKNNVQKIRYCTVVILHIDGNKGGRIFSNVEHVEFYGKTDKPKQRLMTEVQKVVELGWELLDVIEDRVFEVHLDLNTDPKHKSNVAVKEALGYVQGTLGITAKLKPEAFAASSAADVGCNKTFDRRRRR